MTPKIRGAIALSEQELEGISGGTTNLLTDLNQYVSDALDQALSAIPTVNLPTPTDCCPTLPAIEFPQIPGISIR